MNLVFKNDVKKTEALLNKYKEANGDTIKINAAVERNRATASQSRQLHEKEIEHIGRQVPQQDHSNTGVSKIFDDSVSESDPTGLVKGLRKIRALPPEKVYDPFLGMATTKDYYELRADYPSTRLAKAKNDTRTQAGGFDFQAYFDESLLQAFAGFGCFIDEERAGRGQAQSQDQTEQLMTVADAAAASPGRMTEDVF